MNFYDVYTTLSLNPSTQTQLQQICDFVQSPNSLDSLKKALWKRPSRAEHPGMFPFDEETGRIYDSLWKAAQAENYSMMGRLGRWLMSAICPPADDEGMAAYHRKARSSPSVAEDPSRYDYQEPEPQPKKNVYDPEPVEQVAEGWQVSDDEKEIEVVAPRQPKGDEVVKRSKKGD